MELKPICDVIASQGDIGVPHNIMVTLCRLIEGYQDAGYTPMNVKAITDVTVTQELCTPYNSEASYLWVMRNGDGDPYYIVTSDGGSDNAYEPGDWAIAVDDHAYAHGWDDLDVSMDDIAAALDRTGSDERDACDAHNERVQATLYREIMGVVAA